MVLQDEPLEFKDSNSGEDVQYGDDMEEGNEVVEDQSDERPQYQRAKETEDPRAEEVEAQGDEEADQSNTIAKEQGADK